MAYYEIVLRVLRFSLMTLLAALSFALPTQAQVTGQPNNIAASLVAESTTPAGGTTVTIAIDFKPKPGWHGYWVNGGEAGFPPRFDWTLPKDTSISAARYPVPERLIIADLMNHVFNGEHALLFTLTVPNAEIGTKLPIRLKGEWLACTDKICVPERGDLSLDLVVGRGEVLAPARAQFDTWRAALPQPLGSAALFERDGKALRIGVPLPADVKIEDAWFFAETEKALNPATPQKISRDGDRLIIETNVGDDAPAKIEGVLSIGGGKGLSISAAQGVVAAPLKQ